MGRTAQKESRAARVQRMARETLAKPPDYLAGRPVNPLVKRGWRLSGYRPGPGTPALERAVEQVQLARQFNRERREKRNR